jgi:hypothetical protein
MSSIELCGIEFKPTALQVLATTALQQAGIEMPVPTKPTQKKFPTLAELYTKLFEQPLPENMHNSIIDVLVCLRCFLKLRGFQELSDRKFDILIRKAGL